MEAAVGIFASVIWVLFICIFVIKAVKRNSGQAPKGRPVKSAMPKPLAQKLSGSAAPFKSKSISEGAAPRRTPSGKHSVGVLMEDRKNDWLARQMREEERILRRGDLMDLGAGHSRQCAADLLKMYHVESCDANGIDNGEM